MSTLDSAASSRILTRRLRGIRDPRHNPTHRMPHATPPLGGESQRFRKDSASWNAPESRIPQGFFQADRGIRRGLAHACRGSSCAPRGRPDAGCAHRPGGSCRRTAGALPPSRTTLGAFSPECGSRRFRPVCAPTADRFVMCASSRGSARGSGRERVRDRFKLKVGLARGYDRVGIDGVQEPFARWRSHSRVGPDVPGPAQSERAERVSDEAVRGRRGTTSRFAASPPSRARESAEA